MTRRVVGCMTGTSIDGIDAALVHISGRELQLQVKFVAGASESLGPIRKRLRALANQQPMTAAEIASLMADFAQAHARVVRRLLEGSEGKSCDLICVHGQTVHHHPPISWQLMQPAPLAREFRVPVVYDMRAMDIAAGGQGAPITPLADWVLFRGDMQKSTAVVNLGGFCNVTMLQAPALPKNIAGLDVCPCNHVLDAIARMFWNTEFDDNGKRASEGKVHVDALNDLMSVFSELTSRGRSLGTGDETLEWITRWKQNITGESMAATACEAIASAITHTTQGSERVFLAGGGARNATLRRAIASASAAKVELTDFVGIPAEYREAICFAILGALCQDRTPITLPQVTGVPSPAPISGAWVLP